MFVILQDTDPWSLLNSQRLALQFSVRVRIDTGIEKKILAQRQDENESNNEYLKHAFFIAVTIIRNI